MGYRRPAALTTLKWAEGQPLHGLEVTLGELTVDRYLAVNRLSAKITSLESSSDPAAQEQLADLAGSFFDEFAGALREWNLEDDTGQPVPADRAGVGGQGLSFILGLAMQWVSAAAQVDIPLPPGSSNGQPSVPVPPIPMETLSSPPSS